MSKKVLVIHQGALGDVILSFQALIGLRRQEDVELGLSCAGQIGRLAQELSVVDHYYPMESQSFSRLFQSKWTHETIRFIDSHDAVILVGCSPALIAGFDRHYRGKTYWVSSRPDPKNDCHVATYVMGGFQKQGLIKENGGPVEHAGPVLLDAVSKGRVQTGFGDSRTIVIHPGAGSERKRWHVENFFDVARECAAGQMGRVIFLLGPAEQTLAGFFDKEMGPSARLTPADLDNFLGTAGSRAGPWVYFQTGDLGRVVRLLTQSRCFVGNDSGVTHLAAYLGLPTVALFGPSSPARWKPVGKNVTVIRGLDDCSPCFETARSNCQAPRCLSEISIQRVVDATASALAQPAFSVVY